MKTNQRKNKDFNLKNFKMGKMDVETQKINPSLTFELLYDSERTPEESTRMACSLLEELSKIKNIDYEIITSITQDKQRILEDEIRAAATRGKFKVVSGGGAALILSGASKKLNFPNGPLLVIRKNGQVIQAYPRGVQGIKGSRISVIDYLSQLKDKKGPIQPKLDNMLFSEKDLRNLIINRPTLIESGLNFYDIEVKIDSAIIDLVMIDRQQKHLLLEFKLNANDKTIGQVSRYNEESYSLQMEIDTYQIRKGIVTLGVTGQIKKACQENNIELYIVDVKNKGYKNK
jgi:hypothetical protein